MSRKQANTEPILTFKILTDILIIIKLHALFTGLSFKGTRVLIINLVIIIRYSNKPAIMSMYVMYQTANSNVY